MRTEEMMCQSDDNLDECASAEIASARDPLNILPAVDSLGHDRIKALIVVACQGKALQFLEKVLPNREAINVWVLFGQALQMREDFLQQWYLIHDQILRLLHLLAGGIQCI